MEFKEEEKEPEFVLTMSLSEAVLLWRIVNESHRNGNKEAGRFVDALYDFAENSNRYT